MTSAHLQQWIQHPETLNRDTLYELRTWVARYPYFQSLRLLYLKNLYLLHDADFGAELRKAVFYVADRRTLFYLIEGNRYELQPKKSAQLSAADFRDGEPGIDRTLSLIDAFLATMPEEQSSDMELDYSMDYTAYLLQDAAEEPEEETAPLRGQELIDGFIRQSEAADSALLPAEPFVEENIPESSEPVAQPGEETVGIEETETEEEEPENNPEEEEDSAETATDDGYFTETLAKIYVKQQRYDKALEIIKKLSLNYPKKNAYFADQIRFLEKLIINAKSK